MLGTSKIARRLGVSESYAREMCAAGVIPAVRIGKLWRIDEDVLEKWIAREHEKAGTPRLISVNGGRS